jgi:ferrous iron transport protein A
LDTDSKKYTTAARMRSAQRGTVVQIMGGRGLMLRLEAMGIRPGKKLTKVSAMFGHGPVTISVDRMQIAIGFGMADKIIVELDETKG